ncbi:MAG: hypothetical protein WCC38_08065 [Pseudonocardiaceae bacterium]
MSDAMSLAELAGQHVELLPARTVLSLLRAGTDGAGTPGEPGTPGAHGPSVNGQNASDSHTTSPDVDAPSDPGEASSTTG